MPKVDAENSKETCVARKREMLAIRGKVKNKKKDCKTTSENRTR